MEVVALMSGAKGEESYHLYKERDVSHRGHVLIIILIWSVKTCSLFGCLAKTLVLFSIGCSQVGIPSLPIGDFEYLL